MESDYFHIHIFFINAFVWTFFSTRDYFDKNLFLSDGTVEQNIVKSFILVPTWKAGEVHHCYNNRNDIALTGAGPVLATFIPASPTNTITHRMNYCDESSEVKSESFWSRNNICLYVYIVVNHRYPRIKRVLFSTHPAVLSPNVTWNNNNNNNWLFLTKLAFHVFMVSTFQKVN